MRQITEKTPPLPAPGAQPYPTHGGQPEAGVGAATPWGVADSACEIAPGVVRCETPSHGGYYVSPARVAAMPEPLRGFEPWAGPNWYEEDCDWVVVALAFPPLFPDDWQGPALITLERCEPDLYRQVIALRSAALREDHP